MTIRIGTRGSELALAQSRTVAASIEGVTGEAPELIVVRTSGDRELMVSLASFGGAGAFTREIDEGQRAGRYEVSVHSLKDLPTAGREGLRLAAVPVRAPVEDCLVARDGATLADLPTGARVGTGSPRRRAALLRLRQDLEIVGIRGNVGTRIRKVDDGEVDATILARAGLVRLGLEERVTQVLDTDRMLPAAGQGALAIVVWEGAPGALDAVGRLDHASARAEIEAERAVLGTLGGGCHLPMGVLARERDGRVELHARVIAPDGSEALDERGESPAADAAALGAAVGERLLAAGARRLLGT